MAKALSLVEVADQLAQERHPDPRLYEMLVGALRTLADPARDPRLVAPAFFMKALVLEGAGPLLTGCASCGEPADAVDLVAFDVLEGGRSVASAVAAGRSPPRLSTSSAASSAAHSARCSPSRRHRAPTR